MWHVLKNLLGVRSLPPRARFADRDESAARWSARRRPLRTSDLELTEPARRWLELTPAHARPVLLAARHPRIVNRIAALRADLAQTVECLDALLLDERGDRAGFVPAIRAEIVRLGYLCRARERDCTDARLRTEPAPTRWITPTRRGPQDAGAPRRVA